MTNCDRHRKELYIDHNTPNRDGNKQWLLYGDGMHTIIAEEAAERGTVFRPKIATDSQIDNKAPLTLDGRTPVLLPPPDTKCRACRKPYPAIWEDKSARSGCQECTSWQAQMRRNRDKRESRVHNDDKFEEPWLVFMKEKHHELYAHACLVASRTDAKIPDIRSAMTYAFPITMEQNAQREYNKHLYVQQKAKSRRTTRNNTRRRHRGTSP